METTKKRIAEEKIRCHERESNTGMRINEMHDKTRGIEGRKLNCFERGNNTVMR